MSEKKRTPRVFYVRLAVLIVVAAVLVLGAAAFLYIHNYYHAGDRALAALEDPPEGVSVTEGPGDWIVFAPSEGDAAAGIIFYPGGKVQYEAYAPLMEETAREGLFCVLVHMPGNLAVLDKDAAEDVMTTYPEIGDWYIGGHSLGGVIAAEYASKNPEELEGIFLLAAYTTKDLSQTDLKALRIFGSEDRVLNYDNLEKNEDNLPQKQLQGFVIQGGNHAQFGDYGPQKGDGEATISAEEQQRMTAEALAELTEEQ